MRHAVLRANTVRTDSKPRLASPSRLRFVCSVVYSQMAGGPHIDMRYGRVDAPSADFCTPDGRLPGEELMCYLSREATLHTNHTVEPSTFTTNKLYEKVHVMEDKS